MTVYSLFLNKELDTGRLCNILSLALTLVTSVAKNSSLTLQAPTTFLVFSNLSGNSKSCFFVGIWRPMTWLLATQLHATAKNLGMLLKSAAGLNSDQLLLKYATE